MKKILIFLKSKFLWFNLLAAVIVFAVLFVCLTMWIDSYTRHGESVLVPKVIGLNQAEAELILRNFGLTYEIVDSVHMRMRKPGEITEQSPAPESFVKKNRKIYVTVNAKSARLLIFKDYRGYSFRKAQSNYKNLGYTVDSVRFVPSEYSGELLDVECEGKILKDGDKIKEASTLTLIVGKKNESEQILMPSFYGMSFSEAQDVMQVNNLREGAFNFDEDVLEGEGREDFFVYGQEPKEGTMIIAGKNIDLYFSKDKNKQYNSSNTTDDDDFF